MPAVQFRTHVREEIILSKLKTRNEQLEKEPQCLFFLLDSHLKALIHALESQSTVCNITKTEGQISLHN